MFYILILFILILCILVLNVRWEYKLLPLFFVLFCFDNQVWFLRQLPLVQSGRAAVFMALLFYTFIKGNFIFSWRIFPLRIQFLFMLIVSFIIAFFSEYIDTSFHKFTIPLTNFLTSYFLCFIFFYYSNSETFFNARKLILICLLLLSYAAVLNYLSGYNPYLQMLYDTYGLPDNGNDLAHRFEDTLRFRVNSLFSTPFDFGYSCLIINLISLLLYHTKRISQKFFFLCFALSLFCIIIANTRTVHFCFILSLIVFYLFQGNKKRMFKVASLSAIILIIIIQISPKVNELFVTVFSMFNEETDVGGSSMGGRQLQLARSIYYFNESPIIGHGYNYISEYFGQGTGDLSHQDPDLMGFESVAFQLLLERGVVGIIAYLFLYLSIFIFFYKNRNYNRLYAAFGITILISYLFFAFATGELMSVPISMAMIGIAIKNVYDSKEYGCIDNNC